MHHNRLYASYPFYRDVYKGVEIDDVTVFERLCLRASERINILTIWRANSFLLEHPESYELAMAACAVAEILYKNEPSAGGGGADWQDSNGEMRTIESEQVDRLRVSYATPYDMSTPAGQVMIREQIEQAALTHLWSTGLLYRGGVVKC